MATLKPKKPSSTGIVGPINPKRQLDRYLSTLKQLCSRRVLGFEPPSKVCHKAPACRINHPFTGPSASTALKPNPRNPTTGADFAE